MNDANFVVVFVIYLHEKAFFEFRLLILHCLSL